MYDPNCECNTPEWWEDSDDEQGLCPCKYALKQAQKNKSCRRSPCRSHTSRRFDDNDDYGSSQPKYFLDAIPSNSLEPFSQPPGPAQPIPCIAMLNPYEQESPLLERKYNENTRVFSRPYVVPNIVDSQGHYQSSAIEEVLNWKTQNVVSQNLALKRIDSKLDSLALKTDGLAYQIDQRGYMSSKFKENEMELQAIQRDLKRIELDMAKKQSQLSQPKIPLQSKPQFLHKPRTRPPYFTPLHSTYEPGTHSGTIKSPSPYTKGISISEPSSTSSPPSQIPPSQEKNKKAISFPITQPPTYSNVTSIISKSSQTIPPPNTSTVVILHNLIPFTLLQDSSSSDES
ncbi:hypothetical protein K1719_034724 [Acacia pycnantha]|nr:hypothetical protein K1719_034724 [Acacia pycnantha]